MGRRERASHHADNRPPAAAAAANTPPTSMLRVQKKMKIIHPASLKIKCGSKRDRMRATAVHKPGGLFFQMNTNNDGIKSGKKSATNI